MINLAYRPRLDLLEDRCLLSTVTNLNDSGAGSLRDAIIYTPPGGIVDFQPGLDGVGTYLPESVLIETLGNGRETERA